IAKGILQGRVAVAVELISRRTHELHAFRHGMFRKCVYVRDLDGNRNGRVSQRFSAEAAALGPFAGYINGRIADHQFGMRDAVANLETEYFLRSQSTLIELDRFGR